MRSVALPCASSVYTEAGRTRIAFIRPTAMLGLFGAGAQQVAEEVEATVRKIVERAAKA